MFFDVLKKTVPKKDPKSAPKAIKNRLGDVRETLQNTSFGGPRPLSIDVLRCFWRVWGHFTSFRHLFLILRLCFTRFSKNRKKRIDWIGMKNGQKLSKNAVSEMKWPVWDLLKNSRKSTYWPKHRKTLCLRDIEANRAKLETRLKSLQTLQNSTFFNTSKRAKNEKTKKTLENVVSGSKIEQNTRVL